MPPDIIDVLEKRRRPWVFQGIADYLASRIADVDGGSDEARARAYREALQLVLGKEPPVVPPVPPVMVRGTSPRWRPAFARRAG